MGLMASGDTEWGLATSGLPIRSETGKNLLDGRLSADERSICCVVHSEELAGSLIDEVDQAGKLSPRSRRHEMTSSAEGKMLSMNATTWLGTTLGIGPPRRTDELCLYCEAMKKTTLSVHYASTPPNHGTPNPSLYILSPIG